MCGVRAWPTGASASLASACPRSLLLTQIKQPIRHPCRDTLCSFDYDQTLLSTGIVVWYVMYMYMC